jgi:hypothetical protein
MLQCPEKECTQGWLHFLSWVARHHSSEYASDQALYHGRDLLEAEKISNAVICWQRWYKKEEMYR